MVRGSGDQVEAHMQDLPINVLASGGHGGHRLPVLVLLLAVIVALAAGWIIYAARARSARGRDR
jgi:hypothetical protein